MKHEILTAIEKMQEKLEDILREAEDIKKAINVMRKTINMEPLYDESGTGNTEAVSVRPDEYYGLHLYTAVRKIIRKNGQAMSPAAILKELRNGGFNFIDKWKQEDKTLRFLSISLAKNKDRFVPVKSPQGMLYGIKDFYPGTDKKENSLIAHSTFARNRDLYTKEDENDPDSVIYSGKKVDMLKEENNDMDNDHEEDGD